MENQIKIGLCVNDLDINTSQKIKFEEDSNSILASEKSGTLVNDNKIFIGSDDYPSSYKNFNTSIRSLEKWDDSKNIKARVNDFNSEIVACDCLIEDEKNNLFEKRTFPRFLFNKFPNLKEGQLVYIFMRTKSGSIRIDINDANGIISNDLFNVNDIWDRLESI